MNLYEMARRVKRGVRLLDRKIPDWRRVLRRHREEFEFRDGDCCVLGTLEHYTGRMRELLKKADADEDSRYMRALSALRLEGDADIEHGFDGIDKGGGETDNIEMDALSDLWRAEFEKV